MNLKIGNVFKEKEIIEGCLKNEGRAQKELYERYAPVMLTVCRRYIKESDTSEDIMIRAFMIVFEKLSQFRMEGSFEGWIRRIMVNEALGWLRKNKTMYLEVDIDEASKEVNVELISSKLQKDELMLMVQELPDGYRTVFNLYAIEGYTHAEIGTLLGVSVNTSKSQLSRARALLQKRLHDIERQEEAKQIGNGS